MFTPVWYRKAKCELIIPTKALNCPFHGMGFQPLFIFGACRVCFTHHLWALRDFSLCFCRTSLFAAGFLLKTCGLFVISASVSVWCTHLTFCGVFFHSKHAGSSWFQPLLVYVASTSHFATFFFYSNHAGFSWFQPLLVYGARTSYAMPRFFHPTI
jgi:hypothetical protein